jgi:lipoprotein-releasing system permease protein
MGIDPVRHSRTTHFGQSLFYRRTEVAKAFEPVYDPNLLGCVLGIDLALPRDMQGRYTLRAQPPKKAVVLTCFPLNAKGAPARAGTSGVASNKFYYSDHSQSGIARIDYSMVYIPIESAQSLCMAGTLKRISAIFIKFRPGVHIGTGCRRIEDLWNQFRQTKTEDQDSFLLDSVTVESWKEYRRAFIAPMEKEEAIMGVMFSFVGITTVFIVFVVFYMIISHKTKDIGILRSAGASSLDVLGLFCGFAAVIGMIGSCVGVLVGWLFLAQINRIEGLLFDRFGWQLWNRAIYAIGAIPSQMRLTLVVVVVFCALMACLIGALVPAYFAARLRPVEALDGQRI